MRICTAAGARPRPSRWRTSCQALGLDTAAYSDALGWADGDLTLIRSCAETVLAVSRQILHDLTPDDDTDHADVEVVDADAA